LRQQQGDECVLRELVERVAIHRLLGIGPPKSCQTKSRPNLRYASQPPQLSPRAPASQQPGQLPLIINPDRAAVACAALCSMTRATGCTSARRWLRPRLQTTRWQKSCMLGRCLAGSP
jgi:hypothetical protein